MIISDNRAGISAKKLFDAWKILFYFDFNKRLKLKN